MWQLLSQYPSHFQLTGDFLLALHDSIHLPLFSSFMANCQRERCKRSQVRTRMEDSALLGLKSQIEFKKTYLREALI